ncbi:MAG TPA: hypothetical protein VGM77_12675 [Gemmatimonadales bacterium]|jgi:hypothetical protein
MALLPLDEAIGTAARPLRSARGIARLLTAGAIALAVVAVAAWLFRIGWIAAPHWVLLTWVLVAALLIAGGWAARRTMAALSTMRAGALIEELGGWRHGAITSVLEHPVTGTSGELHRAASQARAAEVGARADDLLSPALRRAHRAGLAAIAALVVAVLMLVATRPAEGAVAELWHPSRALRALFAPVQLRARQREVSRGERAQLEIDVIGRATATLLTRSPGEGWHATTVTLDQDGHAAVTTAPLSADLVARVEAGNRHSVDVHVAVRLPAFLGAVTAVAHYPAYLGRDDESLAIAGDTLVLPEGTRLAIAGRATAALARAELQGAQGSVPLAVDGQAIHGVWLPRASGTWQLRVVPAAGGTLDGDLPVVPIRIVIDSAPTVDVPVPGADTVAAPSLTLSVVVSARDDHGIGSMRVETRRGQGGAVHRIALPLGPAPSDRALITTTLDFAALGLHAGDTLRYVAVAEDNAPAPHTGRSREYLVRVPSETEQRAARSQATAAAVTSFDSLSARAARAQRTEEDLARQRPRADAAPGATAGDSSSSDKTPLSSENARTAQAAVQAQQKVMDDAKALHQSVSQLQQAAERQGTADTSLARQLAEINALLDQAISPALREKLAALQQAVKDLDAEQTHDAMQDLAQQQARLKEAMDQARDLFKRAALETSLASLGQDAKQLADDQHNASQQMAGSKPGSADSAGAQAEKELARRADSLASGLERAARQVPAAKVRTGLQQAATTARSASAAMQQAAQSSQAGQQQAAQQQAKKADQQLNPLSKQINQQRQSMQAEMRAEVKQLLERALAETSELTSRQVAVIDALQQGALLPGTRADEGMVEEGAGKIMQQISVVSAMNALVSPQAGVSLAQARQLMRDALEAVSSAAPNSRLAVDKAGQAADALAVAAFSLMQSKDKVDGSQSGSGVQEAMEEMRQMAGQQGKLAQQGAGMMQGGQLSAQQLMQMAMQQRAMAQQLDRLRAGGQLPGAGALAQEAKALSRSLEAGQLNRDIVEREQQLFRRMLDAGRTLQGQEDDERKERQATTAKDAPPAIPGAVDPKVLSGEGEIRLPSWDVLQRLAPEERRRVIDYFQRLMQPSKP